jgi:hypothetical protein
MIWLNITFSPQKVILPVPVFLEEDKGPDDDVLAASGVAGSGRRRRLAECLNQTAAIDAAAVP